MTEDEKVREVPLEELIGDREDQIDYHRSEDKRVSDDLDSIRLQMKDQSLVCKAWYVPSTDEYVFEALSVYKPHTAEQINNLLGITDDYKE